MLNLFPKSWFDNSTADRRRAAALSALAAFWRERLVDALTHVPGVGSISELDAHPALARLSGTQLLTIDSRLRPSWWRDEGWPRKGSAALTSIQKNGAEVQAFLFCAACEANGFVRQQALTAFQHYPGRLATAAALIRADDWVPQVQREALRVLPEVAGQHGETLFEFLDLVAQLRRRQRITPEIWDRLERLLLAPENRDARWRTAREGAPAARMFAYSLVVRADPDRIEQALQSALVAAHPPIASWALTVAPIPADIRQRVLLAGIRCRYANVRAKALREYLGLNAEDARQMLQRSLFDVASAPRAVAAYLLQERFAESPLQRWRDAVDRSTADAPAAFLAIVDAAEREDIPRLQPLISHRNARMRAAALRGLYRAKAPALQDLLHESLQDRSAVVVRQATTIMDWMHDAPPADLLTQAFTSARNDGTRAALARAAHALGKWEALELLLQLAAASDERAFACIDKELRRWEFWSNRRFTPLSADARARLLGLVDVLNGERKRRARQLLAHVPPR